MKALVLSTLVALPACGYAATLSQEQAVALADTVARDKGFDLAKFSSPNAYYEPEYKRNEWFICYKALAAEQTGVGAFYVILNDGSSAESALLTVGECK